MKSRTQLQSHGRPWNDPNISRIARFLLGGRVVTARGTYNIVFHSVSAALDPLIRDCPTPSVAFSLSLWRADSATGLGPVLTHVENGFDVVIENYWKTTIKS